MWVPVPGMRARKNSTGSPTDYRQQLNLIEGSGVTITLADDATDDEIDVTIAASGGGGGGAVTRIDTEELASATASFEFADIPADYRHLRIVGMARSDRVSLNDGLRIRFGTGGGAVDSGSNYDWHIFDADRASNNISQTLIQADGSGFAIGFYLPGASVSDSDTFALFEIDIPFYKNTGFDKAWKSHGGYTSGGSNEGRQTGTVGKWRNTAAIDRIQLSASSAQLVAGSVFDLYGIA